MKQDLHYDMKVRIMGEEKAFGPGVAQLLKGIEEMGSMQKAAEKMGLSYSKAWKMMKTAEQELGFAQQRRQGRRRFCCNRRRQRNDAAIWKFPLCFADRGRSFVFYLFSEGR